jgi:hypothetical protein
MRESYRLNKHAIEQRFVESAKSLDIVFMYVGSRSTHPATITFNTVNLAMQKLVAMVALESKG